MGLRKILASVRRLPPVQPRLWRKSNTRQPKLDEYAFVNRSGLFTVEKCFSDKELILQRYGHSAKAIAETVRPQTVPTEREEKF